MASSRRRQILGKRVLINLNYAGGIRHSPGANPRSIAVRNCAKGKDLASRKACFKITSGYTLSDKPRNVAARAKYAAQKAA